MHEQNIPLLSHQEASECDDDAIISLEVASTISSIESRKQSLSDAINEPTIRSA